MSSCWKFKPDERPNFRKVVKKIENLKVTLPNQPAVPMKKISAAYLPLYS